MNEWDASWRWVSSVWMLLFVSACFKCLKLANLHCFQANNRGVGVIGVIECNFLDPTHNKQSFIESDKYRCIWDFFKNQNMNTKTSVILYPFIRKWVTLYILWNRKTMNNLGIKLEEYWNEIRYRKSKENPNSTVPVEDTMWVQSEVTDN